MDTATYGNVTHPSRGSRKTMHPPPTQPYPSVLKPILKNTGIDVQLDPTDKRKQRRSPTPSPVPTRYPASQSHLPSADQPVSRMVVPDAIDQAEHPVIADPQPNHQVVDPGTVTTVKLDELDVSIKLQLIAQPFVEIHNMMMKLESDLIAEETALNEESARLASMSTDSDMKNYKDAEKVFTLNLQIYKKALTCAKTMKATYEANKKRGTPLSNGILSIMEKCRHDGQFKHNVAIQELTLMVEEATSDLEELKKLDDLASKQESLKRKFEQLEVKKGLKNTKKQRHEEDASAYVNILQQMRTSLFDLELEQALNTAEPLFVGEKKDGSTDDHMPDLFSDVMNNK